MVLPNVQMSDIHKRRQYGAALPERLDFGCLADGRLLKDELLQLGGGGDEANITALLHLPPNPPAAVVLLEDVQEISDFEAEIFLLSKEVVFRKAAVA
jgi:hypothetical protein